MRWCDIREIEFHENVFNHSEGVERSEWLVIITRGNQAFRCEGPATRGGHALRLVKAVELKDFGSCLARLVGCPFQEHRTET